jgi:thiamine pyrophosphate-dependent acetolactate synthase large subunit-like protein
VASEISSGLARAGVMRGVLHESRDQAALFEPLAKAVYRPRTADDAVHAANEAVEVALAWPRGPVYVDIPTDVLDEQTDLAPTPRQPARRRPEPGSVARAVAAIGAAPRVVIWAGGGVIQSGAEEELAALADLLGAAVVTTFAGRGVLPPGHPWLVGLPPHEPEVSAYLGAADLMLAVGTAFDGPMTRNWSMPRPPSLVTVNASPDDLVAGYQPDVGVLGDARVVLQELVGALPAREPDGVRLRELDGLRDATWARLREDVAGAPALAFLDAVGSAIDSTGAMTLVDMAIPGYWYGGYAHVAGPRRLQYPIGWGTLGYALPAAVGAAAVGDRPVLALCGDGGFMYAVGELAVVRERDLPVTILVVDDGGYGMLRYDQDRAGDSHRGVDLLRPDFAALAASFGIPAVTLDAVEGLDAVLTEALSSWAPRMVVLRLALTPPRTTSPRWRD